MRDTIKQIGIIVLAAGASRRMNAPKQLLEYEGKTLLRRAAQTAAATDCASVIVVLGANYEHTKAEVGGLKVEIVFNAEWKNGLSSSLKVGVKKLLEISPRIDAFIVSLADQPFVEAKHFHRFIEKFYQTDSSIIAAKYRKTIGVPALFGAVVFPDFAEISGDKGAKQLIEKHKNSLKTIDLPEAAFDIDTPQDYLNLSAKKLRNK